MNEHEHKKIIRGALSQFKYNPSLHKVNPIELLIEKAKRTTFNVLANIKPILQAGGGFDKPSLQVTLTSLYLEEFQKYSKEELENLITMMHVEEAMGIVDKNPTGSDKGPDLLT